MAQSKNNPNSIELCSGPKRFGEEVYKNCGEKIKGEIREN